MATIAINGLGRIGRAAFKRGIDGTQRVVRFQKEIAAQLYIGELAGMYIKIDDYQLAAGHLVFAVHALRPQSCRKGADRPCCAGRRCPRAGHDSGRTSTPAGRGTPGRADRIRGNQPRPGASGRCAVAGECQ